MKVLDFTLPKVNTSEVLRYMGVKNPTLEDKKIIKYLEQEIEAWYLNKYKEKKGKRK